MSSNERPDNSGLYLIRTMKRLKVQLIFKKIDLIDITAKTIFLSLLQPTKFGKSGVHRELLNRYHKNARR